MAKGHSKAAPKSSTPKTAPKRSLSKAALQKRRDGVIARNAAEHEKRMAARWPQKNIDYNARVFFLFKLAMDNLVRPMLAGKDVDICQAAGIIMGESGGIVSNVGVTGGFRVDQQSLGEIEEAYEALANALCRARIDKSARPFALASVRATVPNSKFKSFMRELTRPVKT